MTDQPTGPHLDRAGTCAVVMHLGRCHIVWELALGFRRGWHRMNNTGDLPNRSRHASGRPGLDDKPGPQGQGPSGLRSTADEKDEKGEKQQTAAALASRSA